MSTSTTTVTADELLQMPDDGYRYELIRGELKRMSPAGYEHGAIIGRLTHRLAGHVESQHLGTVLGAETGIIISRDPDTVRAADVAFVSNERNPSGSSPSGYWEGAPDLAVEVVSPGDRVNEVDEKIAEWLSAGAKLVWVVNPRWKNVTVYRSLGDVTVLNETDGLDGGEVVPGFRCTVGEIFRL